MTKYILNSGGLKNFPEKEKKFNKEIVKELSKIPSILFCYFAVPREHWEEKFARHAEHFLDSMDEEVKPKFEMAMPDKFIDQIKNNDAIIIHGGDDKLLLYWLKQYNLPKIWDGKVVATSSAGSNALAKNFWTCDWRQCLDGLNIIPIKFIPHYKSDFGNNDPRGPIDWQKAYSELSEYGDKTLPIHALEEGDFVIFEK